MLRYRIARPWCFLRRVAAGLSAPQPGFRVLIFHDIDPRDRPVFADFIDYLDRRHGILAPHDVEAFFTDPSTPPAKGREPGKWPCLLSFDDGFESNFTIARDVLEPRGVKALFFVCPSLVSMPPEDQPAAIRRFISDMLATETPPSMMTWEQIAELAERGHRIGAHSQTHGKLSEMSDEALSREIAGSGEELARRLGAPADWFAFPYGDISSISGKALGMIQAHFKYCRSGVRGLNPLAEARPAAIFADHIDLHGPAAYRELTLEGGLDGRYREARQRLRELASASAE